MDLGKNTLFYWINLDDRPDRRSHMLNEFKKYNITNHVRITPIKQLDPGHSATLSHIKAIETAYKDQCEYAIFLEDDIDLENIEKLPNILEKLPNDWEVFQAYTLPGYLNNVLSESEPYKNHLIKNFYMSAAFYVMNKKSIETYLKNFVVKSKPIFIDWRDQVAECVIFSQMNTYSLLYPYFKVIKSKSSICNTNTEHAFINIDALEKIYEKYKFVMDIDNISTKVIEENYFRWYWDYQGDEVEKFLEKCEKCEKYKENIIS